jgi:hypothetical protein
MYDPSTTIQRGRESATHATADVTDRRVDMFVRLPRFIPWTVLLTLFACASPTVVDPPDVVSSVTIVGGDQTMAVGDTLELTASVATTGNASAAVVWTSGNASVATVDAAGSVTSHSADVTAITATSTTDPTKSGSIVLTVVEPGVVAWTRQFGTDGFDFAYGAATDADGNVYSAGLTGGALEGASAGSSDAFVRSYASGGNLRWTRQFGTDTSDSAYGIATDADGNVYTVGSTLGALQGDNAGSQDGFVRSYANDGTLRWTRQFGTSGFEDARAIATDAAGNVYAVGYTDGALEGAHAGDGDAYVRSYDRDGGLRWTRQFGTSSSEDARGVATDALGNVYIAGRTGGDLGGPSAGFIDGFVRSYESDGALRWTRQFGTGTDDVPNGAATDAHGNVYLTGYTSGALEGAHAGAEDAFIHSYADSGALRWTRQFGTGGRELAYGIATDANGNVHAVGRTAGGLEGANAGDEDAFLRSYNGSGVLRWTRQFGTALHDEARGVATDPRGSVYTTGSTDGALQIVNVGVGDAFIRKYGP